MSKPFPPDDSQSKEIGAGEAYERAMRMKLEVNRRARASRASGKSPQSSERSATEDVNSEEVENRLSEKPACCQAWTTVTSPSTTRSMTCLRTRARLSAGATGPVPPSMSNSTVAVSLGLRSVSPRSPNCPP